MRRQHTLWALSYQFDWGRALLSPFSWPEHSINAVMRFGDIRKRVVCALFATEADARAAQETCCLKLTRVEKVTVTIEPAEAKEEA